LGVFLVTILTNFLTCLFIFPDDTLLDKSRLALVITTFTFPGDAAFTTIFGVLAILISTSGVLFPFNKTSIGTKLIGLITGAF
jgi:hypothetical protein